MDEASFEHEEEQLYDPSAIVSEPKPIRILDFLIKEQGRLQKYKDQEMT